MLRTILDAFANSPGPVSVGVLAAQLDLEVDMLEGMLAELARMGRLVRIEDRAGTSCAACGIKGRCPYLLSVSGTYYALPEMVTPGTPC